MQTKFKRHQLVRLLRDPDLEYIEYNLEDQEDETNVSNLPQIKKGAAGKINILLPNGQYHVEILDAKGNTIAYVPAGEDDLEAIESLPQGDSAEDE